MQNVSFTKDGFLQVKYIKIKDETKGIAYWIHPQSMTLINYVQNADKIVRANPESDYIRAYTEDGNREVNLLMSLGTLRYTRDET